MTTAIIFIGYFGVIAYLIQVISRSSSSGDLRFGLGFLILMMIVHIEDLLKFVQGTLQ